MDSCAEGLECPALRPQNSRNVSEVGLVFVGEEGRGKAEILVLWSSGTSKWPSEKLRSSTALT